MEESTDNILAYHSATVAGLRPFESNRLGGGHSNGKVHPNILSSMVSQGTVRNLSAAQVNRYRHLLPPRLTTSHYQYHENRASSAATSASSASQRIASSPSTSASNPSFHNSSSSLAARTTNFMSSALGNSNYSWETTISFLR